jgi:hypothetical protein
MRTVAKIEAGFRVGSREAVENFVGIQAHAGERIADAIGRVQRDVRGSVHGQSSTAARERPGDLSYSIPYCFIFR